MSDMATVSTPASSPPPVAGQQAGAEASAPAHPGQFLRLARWACALLGLVSFGYWLTGLAQLWRDARYLEQGGLIVPDELVSAVSPTPLWYAIPEFGFSIGYVVVCILAAVFIFLKQRDDWSILPVVVFLTTIISLTYPPDLETMLADQPIRAVTGKLLTTIAVTTLFCLPLLFPTGRFVPRWTVIPAILWLLINLDIHFRLDGEMLVLGDPVIDAVTLVGLLVIATFALVYRYRRASRTIERQQMKWGAFGLIVCIGLFVGLNLAIDFGAFESLADDPQQALTAELMFGLLFDVNFLIVPLALSVAILRYRLWDIDLIISRTAVYLALTASVLGIYIVVVGWLGVVFQTGSATALQTEPALLFSLVATGIVAVLFQPLHGWIQRGVNRLLYGERDEPYAVISRLGRRLEDSFAPDAVLPTIVTTVREALKLPYAAIALGTFNDQHGIAAASGVPIVNPIRLPLTNQNEQVGELLLAPRTPGESFTAADHRLLGDLTRQAGVAVHAVLLTRELQQARERLVEAREEERRRLRRDLHDGLGSQLAALSLQIGALRQLMADDHAAADAQAQEIRNGLRATIATIREIAHDLRPPALDEFGLAAALQARVQQFSSRETTVRLEAPEPLPPLSAAVEVAIYRIVEEALTNVARHARARQCTVRLAVGDAISLTIEDDGVGLAQPAPIGVGLVSMRERAEELGGSCRLEQRPGGGTRVCVSLPRKSDGATDG